MTPPPLLKTKVDSLLKEWSFLNQILAKIRENQKNILAVQVRFGLAYLCARLVLQGYSCIAVDQEERAVPLAEDTKTFLKLFGLQDCVCGFFPDDSLTERAAFLEKILRNQIFFLSTTGEALSQKTFSKENFEELRTELKVGKVFPYTKLVAHLSQTGYRRVNFVEEPGEFSVRGAVLDFWSPDTSKPVRLLFRRTP